MRRAALALITGAMLFALAACGRSAGASLSALRASLEDAASVTVTASVSSVTGGRAREYTLECKSEGGKYALSVLAPAEIAGVSASYDGSVSQLEFDGLILPCGGIEGLSPLTALPELLEALKSGYETLSWEEGESTLVSLETDGAAGVTVELDSSGLPVGAEFTVSGESAAVCEITQFLITEA